MKKMRRIKLIATTGGHCGGKTTILSQASQKLADFGVYPIIIPEASTEFRLAGLNPQNMGGWNFQGELLQRIIENEDRFRAAAKLCKEKNVVLLADRGVMDNAAYLSPASFSKLLKKNNTSRTALRDRYDAVIHLRSVAVDRPEFYTLENNKARSESVAEAIVLDQKTLNAWTGHAHLRVIDNTFLLKTKTKHFIQEVCAILGIPVPVEDERKFLIERPSVAKIPVHFETMDIVQDYLVSSDKKVIERVRKRGQSDAWSYYHTIKEPIGPGKNTEFERTISQEEYLAFLSRRDPAWKTIKKRRLCFVWENQYFELDLFGEPDPNLCLLEYEKTTWSKGMKLPPFLKVEKEVTGDLRYSNQHIAKN